MSGNECDSVRWHGLCMTDVWQGSKRQAVCECVVREKWVMMRWWPLVPWVGYLILWWIADPVARLLLGVMLCNWRNWFNLWCTNEWQQSSCWRGDGGSWEQKTSMPHYSSEVLYTSCSGIASSSTMCSCLLYYFQNCPSPNPEIGNKHWKTNRTCLIWKVKEKGNTYGIGVLGLHM